MGQLIQFPIMINDMYTEAYIEEQYRIFYDEEEEFRIMNQWENEQKKRTRLSKLIRKILYK